MNMKFTKCSEYSVAAIFINFSGLKFIMEIHQSKDGNKELFRNSFCNDVNDVSLKVICFKAEISSLKCDKLM